jgi:hypothetical protein
MQVQISSIEFLCINMLTLQPNVPIAKSALIIKDYDYNVMRQRRIKRRKRSENYKNEEKRKTVC